MYQVPLVVRNVSLTEIKSIIKLKVVYCFSVYSHYL